MMILFENCGMLKSDRSFGKNCKMWLVYDGHKMLLTSSRQTKQEQTL